MSDFLYRYINPVRLNLFFDSLKASLGVIVTLCLSFWLTDDYSYHKFAFIFSLQLVYAKSGVSLKKRFPFTLFWSICLGLALAFVPLLSGLLITKSVVILLVIFITFSLKDKFLLFNNNLANQFVLDFCVFLFLLPPGKFDPLFLLISVICGFISSITDSLILNKKAYRMVKFNLLRTFLKIPLNLKKLSKKAKNIKRYTPKENYFFYIETINEIQEIETVLIPEEKQKIFYTKLIFFTGAAFRALKIIEFNLNLCPKEFTIELSPLLKNYALAYQQLSAYIFHKKVKLDKKSLKELCQKFKSKHSQSLNHSQAKILVCLERLTSLAQEIYEYLENENK